MKSVARTSYCVDPWKKTKPKAGQIVCHYLYKKSEWKAIVLGGDDLDYKDSKTYIRMLPGVKLEEYFAKGLRSGWIYTKWIWILREDFGDVKTIKTFYD